MTDECKLDYLIGEDGWYLKKVNPIFEAVVKVGSNPTGDSVDEKLLFHAAKIKGSTFRSWQEFCREVAKRNRGHSEAALMLLYHPGKKVWHAFPPKQDLSSVTVDFSGVSDALNEFRKEHGNEWLLAGTLHSHPGSAHPSGTDVEDEKKMDGVHIVIPDFGSGGEKGIHAHICASGVRFSVQEASGFLVDFSVKGSDPVPEAWYSQCKWDTGTGKRYSSGGRGHGGYKGYGYGGYGYSDSYYRTGNEFIYKGEGSSTFKVTVGKREMNVLAEQFKDIDQKVLLKKLGFPKSQRKFLCSKFETELSEMITTFEHAREALEYVKDIRGEVSKTERETVIDRIGETVEITLEMILNLCEFAVAGKYGKQDSGEDDSVGEAEEDDIEEVEETKSDKEGGRAVSPSESDHRDLTV